MNTLVDTIICCSM